MGRSSVLPLVTTCLIYVHASSLTQDFILVLSVTFTSAGPLQVLIEATVSRERRGYIAVDDIMVLNYPCCKLPDTLERK